MKILPFLSLCSIQVFYLKLVQGQCDNQCTGSCSPLNLTTQISGSGSITYVWIDPQNKMDTVDEYFLYFSDSPSGPWITVDGFLFAQYPAFYDAPPCDISSSATTCNRGKLQGLTVGTRYYLRVSAGRCCASFLDTPGCESCSASDYLNCPLSSSTTTSVVAMGIYIFQN